MLKHNVRLLSIFNFFIGFNIFAPLAIIYFSKVSGSFTLGTSIFGIIMLASAFFELPTGILSDRVGRKYTIIFGSVARIVAFICYAVGLSYWWLALGAILEGLSRAFYSGNNDALLYDTLADENQTNKYDEFQGKVNSTEQASMAISALLSSLIIIFSFNHLLWFTVFIQIVLLIVSCLLKEPSVRRKLNTNVYTHLKEAIVLFISNPKLRILSITSIISYSISELKWQFSTAFIATVWPLWALGIAKVIPSIGASISFYFSGKLIKKFSAQTILLFDSIYGKMISFIALLFPTIFSPLLMSTPSFLYGVSSVAERTLMQQEFSNHQRATMSSLNSFGGSIGFAIMSIVLGGLADRFSPATALIILTIISLPNIFFYWKLFMKKPSH